ncbi:PepSY domain-containing protein [Saccharibacillus sp. JS10]|uniref:PepSY domain-containing protein n=1 Tax=Saccharibacillus sp. JS10 TaxID=2950552 RepID=UPI00210C2344|nr:PepSY domain-containing protein [Saccharibacillus sp. JS10]MCQ4088225.1 PepSY domain-containing protein [Saccharibacillus sp. JS10]
MVKRKVMIGAVAAALTLGGTAALASGTGTGNVAPSAVKSSNSSTASIISPERAKEIALKAQAGTVDDVDLETKNGKTYYEVDIDRTNGTDVDVWIDANTGSVLKVVQDDDKKSSSKSDKKKSAAAASVKVTSAQAEEIALKQSGGGTVTDIDLEKEHGRFIYEIEVQTTQGEAKIEIDANTGKVLSYDVDFDDDYEDDGDDD